VFLASPLASYVTGATLVVHGGGERPGYLAATNADVPGGTTPRERENA
jgi:NAD(P)-dependent dehydrogenase (short-subunit alcohol dehydrogenase family)